MATMMCCPPQGSLLGRRSAKQRNQELEGAAGLIRAMREVTMVAGSQTPHSHEVEPYAKQHSGKADSSKDDRKNCQVHQDERNRLDSQFLVDLLACCSRGLGFSSDGGSRHY